MTDSPSIHTGAGIALGNFLVFTAWLVLGVGKPTLVFPALLTGGWIGWWMRSMLSDQEVKQP